MAASRRGQPPLSVHLPQPGSPALLPDLPPISALFLIDFDVKAGYTIIWKQALAGLELEGVVEYKSLPSGLHTVPEDLIYFVHDNEHAGLSAFLNTKTDDEATRHARMIAVGILVPLSYGRLGRAWRHAEGLKEMAAKLATDQKETKILEQYWEKNRARDTTAPQPLKDSPLSPSVTFKASPPRRGHFRNRSASDGGALIAPGHRLSPFHPAWSLNGLLDTFGPLIFPIHRAALLRKRILISTHAPVQEACNYVYDISILSNIPSSVADIIEPSASAQRLKPLFTIGVHDLSDLLELPKRHAPSDSEDASEAGDSGWVACTTDSILAMKEGLWDMLITLPPNYAANAVERVWPAVECPKGVPVKATQRDLRRYRSLKLGLSRLTALAEATAGAQTPQSGRTSETPGPPTPGIRLSSSRPGTSDDGQAPRSPTAFNDEDADKIVEPTTWAALAYSGFLWWASAGEQRRGDEVEESAHDATLLADLAPPMPMPHRRASFGGLSATGALADSVASLAARRAGDSEDDEDQARAELAIIAYFHRLTTGVLGVLADVVDSSDDDDLLDVDVDAALTPDEDGGDETDPLRRSEEEDSRGWVRVGSDDIANMGLDVWSKADADFVREATERYFARRAYVETKGVEVCGLRVC